RRRNRATGLVRAADAGLVIKARASFGNRPAHIHGRAWRFAEPAPAEKARTSHRLDAGQRARIAAADTLFIGSGYRADGHRLSDGYDASHRGGSRGFVRLADDGTRLRIPDYAGNNYFNTIGNLLG